MPSKYVKKNDSKVLSDDDLLDLLKAIKIDNKKPYAVAVEFEIPKTNVYRLIAAFEEIYPKTEAIDEEKLKKYVSSRNKQGVKSVSSIFILFFSGMNL